MVETIFIDNSSSYFLQNLDNLLVSLEESITLIHIDNILGSEQAIIRFKNEYGACIFQSLCGRGKNVFEILIIIFNGLGPNNYELAQYIPVPEVNWSFASEDILSICNQVSLLQNKVPTLSS